VAVPTATAVVADTAASVIAAGSAVLTALGPLAIAELLIVGGAVILNDD
jgi:hypothetical protein